MGTSVLYPTFIVKFAYDDKKDIVSINIKNLRNLNTFPRLSFFIFSTENNHGFFDALKLSYVK